jgi:hypothetical protein
MATTAKAAKKSKTAKRKTAVKKAGKVSDAQKLQEIIGRAMKDKKFAGQLARNPRKVAADHGLSKATAALMHKGSKLHGELSTVAKKLHKGGLDYQSV